jgi:hypothetical protein
MRDEELTRLLRRVEIDDPDRAPLERVFIAVDRERRSNVASRRRRFLARLPLPGQLFRRTATGIVLVAAVLVVAVASGLVGRLAGVGGPDRPSASPTPTSVPVTTYVSPIYGYSIEYPASWLRRDAERQLNGMETPWDSSPAVDYISAPQQRRIIVGASLVDAGTTLEAWTNGTAIAICGESTKRESLEVDGEPATHLTYDQCNGLFHQWVTVIHGTSAWHIVWLSPTGTEVEDRDQFLLVLATFQFPERPLPTPTAS